MKIRLRLGDADRERYQCPEWIELDPLAVSMRDAVAMQAGADVDGVTVAFDSPAHWRKALSGSEGHEGSQLAATLVMVWMALRRAGVKVSLSELDFDSDSLGWEMVPDPYDEQPDAEGKDESAPETTS